MRPRASTPEHEAAQLYFLRGLPLTIEDLRRTLRHPDVAMRAHWIAHVMREARYEDVWQFLSQREIRDDYPQIRRHLGRARPFWDFLVGSWQERQGKA